MLYEVITALLEIALADLVAAVLRGADEHGVAPFYATWFAEKHDRRAVLINPAIRPDLGLAAYLGPQRNLYTGEAFVLSEAHLAGWRRLVVDRIDPERYLLLLV